MIRSQLVRKLVQTHPHLPRSAVEATVDTILNEITDRLAQGHRAEFRGFGSFASKIRNARMGQNPRTGETVQVARKQILQFRAAKQILKRLNSPVTSS